MNLLCIYENEIVNGRGNTPHGFESYVMFDATEIESVWRDISSMDLRFPENCSKLNMAGKVGKIGIFSCREAKNLDFTGFFEGNNFR